MATRALRPGAGLDWFKRAFNLGHSNAKAVLGGAGILLVAGLLPSLVTMPIQAALPPTGVMLGVIIAVTVLAALALVPLYGGYLALIHDSETGQAPRARNVFAVYRSGKAPRIVGFALMITTIYLAAFAALAFTVSPDLPAWYMKAMAASQAAGGKAVQTTMPEGFMAFFGLGMCMGLFLGGVYAIGLGQVTLGGRGALDALKDGVAGTLKNVLPLLVLLAIGLGVGITFMLLFMVIAFIAAMLAAVAGPWAMFVVLAPFYIALMVAVYVVGFGIVYHMWSSICGQPTERAVAA